ncbi:hypothetical protein N7495_006067 [Penicillium taxi]|uniref:uncharacterized protein n=1 Tax=Penicillium taxi TaxID=168475 RepID=UPI0025459EFF|nr:uncharacterized protein N7495_006067 [Penicillium taxi]KAJ5894376.1 hypothetical protein N7495_006067 [Penicillium taxi]
MVLISSKRLIQIHAVLLITIAGYLIKDPVVITNSNIVFMMGEALGIDFPVNKSTTQSPYVFCSVLLFSEALVDIVLLSSLPYRNALTEALPYIRPLRNGNLASEDLQILDKLPEYITRSLTTYWNVWTSVAGIRSFMYAALSIFIYSSKGGNAAVSYSATSAVFGLDQLKTRVVFTFGFLEMMFWFWGFAILRQERQERLTDLLEDATKDR